MFTGFSNKRSSFFFLFLICDLALLSVRAETAEGERTEPLHVLAKEIVQSINERDSAAFCANIDMPFLAMRTAEKAYSQNPERELFALGLGFGFSEYCHGFIGKNETHNSHAKFLPSVERDKVGKFLIRLDSPDLNSDYIEFEARKNENGDYEVVDWYLLTTGQFASDRFGVFSRLLTRPDKTILKNYFKIDSFSPELIQQIKKMEVLNRIGRERKALKIYLGLPNEVKYERSMLAYGFGLANRSGLETEYRLLSNEIAAKYSKEPWAAYLLVEHYQFQKQWEKALAAINILDSKYGNDGVMEDWRATIYLDKEDYDNAITHAENAIEHEPNLADGYLSLIDGYIGAKRFQSAIEVMKQVEAKFNLAFDKAELKAEPSYTEFVNSKSFTAWSQSP